MQVAKPRAPRWQDMKVCLQLLLLELLMPWLRYTPWELTQRLLSWSVQGSGEKPGWVKALFQIIAPFLHTRTVLEPNQDTTTLLPLDIIFSGGPFTPRPPNPLLPCRQSCGMLVPPTHLMCPHRPQSTRDPTEVHTGVSATFNSIFLFSAFFTHQPLGLY